MVFKDEPVTQVLVQYVKLLPAARMRISESKMADKLESNLRQLQSRSSKIPNSRLLIEEIQNVQQELKSLEFQQKYKDYFQN